MELGSSLNSNSNPFSLILKPSHQGRVWNLQILSCNHENLNSYSGRLRQIGIFGNLSDFSKPVWIPNKFELNSKIVLLLGFLIQILFRI
jgi:hypothetical protein